MPRNPTHTDKSGRAGPSTPSRPPRRPQLLQPTPELQAAYNDIRQTQLRPATVRNNHRSRQPEPPLSPGEDAGAIADPASRGKRRPRPLSPERRQKAAIMRGLELVCDTHKQAKRSCDCWDLTLLEEGYHRDFEQGAGPSEEQQQANQQLFSSADADLRINAEDYLLQDLVTGTEYPYGYTPDPLAGTGGEPELVPELNPGDADAEAGSSDPLLSPSQPREGIHTFMAGWDMGTAGADLLSVPMGVPPQRAAGPRSATSQSLDSATRVVGSQVPGAPGYWQCSLCGTTASLPGLWSHNKQRHELNPSPSYCLQCTRCPTVFHHLDEQSPCSTALCARNMDTTVCSLVAQTGPMAAVFSPALSRYPGSEAGYSADLPGNTPWPEDVGGGPPQAFYEYGNGQAYEYLQDPSAQDIQGQYGQSQYGQSQYGQSQYGQSQYGAPYNTFPEF